MPSSFFLILSIFVISGHIVYGQQGTTASVPVDPNFECPYTGFFPVSETSCLGYYYACYGNDAYLLECPNDLIFDPVIGSCKNANEVSACRDLACPEPDGRFPIPGEVCSRVYIVCAAGVAYDTVCPGLTVFDPVLRVCSSPENVPGCPSFGGSTSTSRTSSTTSNSTVTEDTTDNGSSSTDDQTTGTTETGGSTTTSPPFTGCQGKPDGQYPEPGDCNKYHVCVGGVDFPTTCIPDSCFIVTGPGRGCCENQNCPTRILF